MKTTVPVLRVWNRTAASVFAAAILALSAGTATAAKDSSTTTKLAQVLRRSVLLFPVEINATGVPNSDDISSLMSDVVSSRLSASGTYSPTDFSRSLPTVARLRNEQQLSETDVTSPFNNAKALKIGKAIEYDAAFLPTIEDYKYNDTDRQADVTVSGTLLDVNTGKVIKLVTLSASSAAGGTGNEDAKAQEAVRAASEKMMAQILPFTPPPVSAQTTPTKTVKPKKKARMDWLWAVLAVGIGLGIGLTTGGGGGGGSTTENPPAPPGG